MKDIILKVITIFMIFIFMFGISALDSEPITTPVAMMVISMLWFSLIAAANRKKFNNFD